jgi:hypothetical protein
MKSFDVYMDYLCLKNHFTKDTYDYFKYNGKMKLSQDTFEKRKDKYFFEKLAKQRNPHDFMVANFSKNPKYWIRDLASSPECQENYTTWERTMSTLSYEVQSALSNLEDNFDSNILVNDNEHPILLRLFLSGVLSSEIFVVLVDIINCKPYWDRKMNTDFVWNDVSMFLTKYTPFINYDKEKIKKIIVDTFSH